MATQARGGFVFSGSRECLFWPFCFLGRFGAEERPPHDDVDVVELAHIAVLASHTSPAFCGGKLSSGLISGDRTDAVVDGVTLPELQPPAA